MHFRASLHSSIAANCPWNGICCTLVNNQIWARLACIFSIILPQNMRLFYLLAFASSFHTVGHAQAVRTYEEPVRSLSNKEVLRREEIHNQMGQYDIRSPQKTYYPVPYWTKGELRPYAGAPSRPWLLYNAALPQLLTRSATGEPQPLNIDEIREFSVGDSLLGTRRTYRRYLNAKVKNAALRTAFFEVRHDARNYALLRHSVILTTANGAPYARQSSFKSEEKSAYYFYYKSGESNTIVPIELKEESVLAAVNASPGEQLADYIRKNHLKLTREKDVITLLRHLDTP